MPKPAKDPLLESAGKVEPPHCDGIHHRWSYDRPIRCLGCDMRFADPVALEREIELRKRGLVELKARAAGGSQ